MDSLNSSISVLHSVPWLQVLITVISSVAILGFLYIASLENEVPVRFTIPIPDQCDAEWRGEVLEKPDIKVDP